jgi:hypothetical protein
MTVDAAAPAVAGPNLLDPRPADMASPAQGDGEHESERPRTGVSERAQAATKGWAARTVG